MYFERCENCNVGSTYKGVNCVLNLRFNFHRVTVLLSVVSYLEKGLTPKIGMLYFIILNKRSFLTFFVLD